MSTFRTAAPVIPCKESPVCRCLLEAMGEKRRLCRFYQEAARRLEAEGLLVIAHAFRFTAAQEEEHAAVLECLLTARGGTLPPAGDEQAPPSSPIELLRAAAAAEHNAWDERYPHYIRTARAEGCLRAAGALERIAETDHLHAMRFVQYMTALADGSLLQDPQRISWVCLACGQLHTGCEPPASCSGCSGGPGHFIRTSFYPFSVEA